MRRFVVLGHRAITSADFKLDDLCGSTGRLDILLRCVNSAFFLSHSIRRDVEITLMLLGEPNPPKTIRIDGSEVKYLNPDERSTAALIRNALMQKGEGERRCSPGIYVSERSYQDVLSNISKESQMYYLKEDGADIRSCDFVQDNTFVMGDDQDLTPEEEEILMNYEPKKISLGPVSYHADHCVTLVNNELDRKNIA
ncbi:MAG: tRNA (pseudouridine(54)-N(1))-methyltransferase TrmY [Thermoplasmata archaeon]|nr:tRNA (pseudouridine(54)-N(1))-methyltransferase TrmY [Thermoplasmata archaeon]MBU1157866.1 tRNA (pseudouridine(54)-N(1))-methyltransferase TrmY [Candidatus Thermoplasmatota archaeon]MCJ7561561.1 tRNA (pseudouridine(54)-N(1))-methyltransferase TrmY [Thermoplasmata archaeon]